MLQQEFTDNELYRNLITDVLRILGYPERTTPFDIKGAGLDIFCEKLSSYIGCDATMDQKTIRKHLQEPYDPGMLNNSLFAAAWLIARGILNSSQLTILVTSRGRKDLPFWTNYVHFVKNPGLLTQKLAEIAEQQKPVKKLPEMFAQLQLPDVYERRSLVDKFVLLSLSAPVIKVEGLSGNGKTYFMKSVEVRLKQMGSYSSIYWKPLFRGYTLDLFIREFEQYVPLGAVSPIIVKAMKIFEYLQTSQSLLVFQNAERADDESFRDFFEIITRQRGQTRIVVINNFNAKFSFIKPSQTIPVKNYEPEELTGLLRQMAIELDEAAFQKLQQKTNGVPAYVWIVIEQVVHNEISMDHFNEFPDAKDWARRTLSRINEEEQHLLHCLCLYNQPFSSQTAVELGTAIGIREPASSLHRLLDHFFIESASVGWYKIAYAFTIHFENPFGGELDAMMHEAIGGQLFQYKRFSEGNALSIEDLLVVIRAINHFQEAKCFKKSQRYLLRSIDALKRKGLYHQIIAAINGEPADNLTDHPWLLWHCAHCHSIRGTLWDSIAILNQCIHIAFLRMTSEKRNEDANRFLLKSLMLFAEITATLRLYREGISILSAGLAQFHPDELEFNLRMHALSILSWFYLKTGAEEDSMLINQNILADSFATSEQAKGVANTRVGVIYLSRGNFHAAEQHLSNAINSFREFDDQRGLCWALRWWLKCQYDNSKRPIPEIPLIDVLQFGKESDLFDEDYLELLKTFDMGVKDPEVKSLLAAELQRVSLIANGLEDATQQASLNEAISKIFWQIKEPATFNYRIYNKPFVQSSLPSDSKAMHSFIDKVAKNPMIFMENLFIKDAKTVLGTYQNNKVSVS